MGLRPPLTVLSVQGQSKSTEIFWIINLSQKEKEKQMKVMSDSGGFEHPKNNYLYSWKYKDD